MESKLDTAALTALGHEGRLAVFRLLARRAPDWVPAGELANALGLKQNTLSVYVAILTRAGLLRQRRAGRSILYRVDFARTGALVDFLVNDCCRGRPELCEPLASHALRRLDEGAGQMSDRVFNVLFICTGNSARSIFAEAILAREGGAKFRAFSAGTRPGSGLNPNAVAVLEHLGHDISGLRAKHVSEFQGPDAPRMDFVFTVCDRAANEECPSWPGQPGALGHARPGQGRGDRGGEVAGLHGGLPDAPPPALGFRGAARRLARPDLAAEAAGPDRAIGRARGHSGRLPRGPQGSLIPQ